MNKGIVHCLYKRLHYWTKNPSSYLNVNCGFVVMFNIHCLERGYHLRLALTYFYACF